MKSASIVLFCLALAFGCNDDIPATGGSVIAEDPRPVGLSAPKLTLAIGIETGILYLHWSESPGAEYYTLESDIFSSFSVPLIVLRGPDREFTLEPPAGDSFNMYYRVRAETDMMRSNWSNVVVLPGSMHREIVRSSTAR